MRRTQGRLPGRRLRIGIGGIWHETNSFVPFRTGIADFYGFQWAERDALEAATRGTATELGGMIDSCAAHEITAVPLFYAAAVPSGLVSEAALAALIAELRDAVRAARDLDALALVLHGAMVAESQDDVEAAILRALREEIPSQLPIAIALDLHANVSAATADLADLIVGYTTFPHTDAFDRGAETIDLLVRVLTQGAMPHSHLECLPLLTVPQCQDTNEEPARGLMAIRSTIAARPEIWTASVFLGYPYSDIARAGVAVYVAGDDIGTARSAAAELADAVWRRRQDFTPSLVDPADAVVAAETAPPPVALVDVADNVGGGSPGDTTELLELLESRGREDAVVVIWDPYAIEELYEKPVEIATVVVGGRSTHDVGDSVEITGAVRLLGTVSYRRQGPYMTGQHVNMGRVAVVESRAGEVVITERRTTPFDDDHLRACGVTPEAKRVIVVKSASAWKSSFGKYVRTAYYIDGKGYCSSDLTRLPASLHLSKKFPLNKDATWPAR